MMKCRRVDKRVQGLPLVPGPEIVKEPGFLKTSRGMSTLN